MAMHPLPKDPSHLGELEMQVLHLLWEGDWTSVSDVHAALATERELAYTTIMTVLTRLFDQGYLERRKVGRAFHYRALVQREAIAQPLLKRLVDRLLGGDVSPVVGFLKGKKLSATDIAALENLISQHKQAQSSETIKGRRSRGKV